MKNNTKIPLDDFIKELESWKNSLIEQNCLNESKLVEEQIECAHIMLRSSSLMSEVLNGTPKSYVYYNNIPTEVLLNANFDVAFWQAINDNDMASFMKTVKFAVTAQLLYRGIII